MSPSRKSINVYDGDAPCRACIGRNLAIMQLHIIIATLFRRYDFTLQSDKPVSCLSTEPSG